MKKIFLFATLLVLMVSLLMVSVSAGYDANTGQWSVDLTSTLEDLSGNSTVPVSPEFAGKYMLMLNMLKLFNATADVGMTADGEYELITTPFLVLVLAEDYTTTYTGVCTSFKYVIDNSNHTYVFEMVVDGVTRKPAVAMCGFDTIDINSYFTSYGEDLITTAAVNTPADFGIMYIEPIDDPQEDETIFTTWSGILEWVIDSIQGFTVAFYTNGQLTLLGYLAILPVAFGICLLVISIIKGMLQLR